MPLAYKLTPSAEQMPHSLVLSQQPCPRLHISACPVPSGSIQIHAIIRYKEQPSHATRSLQNLIVRLAVIVVVAVRRVFVTALAERLDVVAVLAGNQAQEMVPKPSGGQKVEVKIHSVRRVTKDEGDLLAEVFDRSTHGVAVVCPPMSVGHVVEADWEREDDKRHCGRQQHEVHLRHKQTRRKNRSF
ncbi:hypothetical protein BaRGS_00009384 [Batillaria attramentaria]|uniref:Uncharacterized protein n=1 Tax=Batillaria attramentaria TaxID=370345 RepID=A0ABD0LIS2_9CAEN